MNEKEYIKKLIIFFSSLKEEIESVFKHFQSEYDDFQIENSCKIYHKDIEELINDYVFHFLKIHKEQLTLSYPIPGIYDFPTMDEISANYGVIKITPQFFVILRLLMKQSRLFSYISQQLTNIIAEEVVKRINTFSLSDCEVVDIKNYKAVFINNRINRLRNLRDFDRWIAEINTHLEEDLFNRLTQVSEIYYSVEITREFDITRLPKAIPLRYVEEDFTLESNFRKYESVDCSVTVIENKIVLSPLISS